MAKGDYYFPLYYTRLLSSTIGWKDDEFGAYLRLLIYQFDNGSIPAELNELARIAPSVKKNWKLLSKKFVPDGSGGLVNNVMQEIHENIQKMKNVSVENGKKGGRPKKPAGFLNGNLNITREKPDPYLKITQTKPILIDNNKKIEDKNKEERVKAPPTLTDVKNYFKENGYSEQAAEKAFRYYNSSNWIDSRGNKVKNWKQKMQGVWFKDENIDSATLFPKKEMID